ncbi:homoserine acetyltransferase [Frankia sp. R43]|uniref:homoserine O-acetyltransferase MetX n=1 Tax=Frankia sp. R43 TaxID=269536 RepID=UPI0006CA0084|nr:homoserine O-acetyltransferase [Frankia sp. R43]KPM51688.1 homoserine acetyltransferase [Frankia sp. R43]
MTAQPQQPPALDVRPDHARPDEARCDEAASAAARPEQADPDAGADAGPDPDRDGARPARAGWQPGDPVGRRRFARLARPLDLERGGVLPEVTVAYETWGRLAPDRSNAVLVLHALTGDSHVAGPAGPGHPTAGWWGALVGPGAALDTDRWFVVCPNVLGGCQGTTGPASAAPDGRPWGSRWPEITVGDQVRAEEGLADALGITRWAAVVGGSMGGMRALEWAVGRPERVARAVVLSCGAAATAEQIALYATQLAVIRADQHWHGGDYHHLPAGLGPRTGLALARQMGQVSYRSEAELAHRFGQRVQPDGRYAAASYVEHHGHKLVRRFDAGTYVTLTLAMMSQDVGRGRGGIAAALRGVTVPVTVAGIDSDRLYPPRLQAELARHLGTQAVMVRSEFGHDGFLLESAAVGRIVATALGSTG